MSFIYDNDKLLSELIKSAIDHELKFNKHGQMAADPSVNVEFRNYLTLSQKLAQQLENTYFPPAADTSAVSTATNKEAPMGVPDLASLGNFLDFIVNNQITVGGKRIAYGAGEKNPDPQHYLPVTAEQIKFMAETETPEGERTQFQADYYVNRDLLVKYITDILRRTSQQDERAQQFIKAMLGARLQDINRVFRTNLTTDYKEPEKVLPDNTTLDTVPKDLDPQQWFNPGNVKLTVGDLKTPMSFNAWLSNNSISIKIGERRMMINHPEFDRCAIVQILFKKAKYNADRATDQNAAQIAAAYDKSVRALATAINCNLGEQQPGQGQGQQQGAGGTTQISDQALIELSAIRPFNTGVIDFTKIKSFVDKYEQLANRPEITSMAQQVNLAIDELKHKFLSVSSDTFMIGMLVSSPNLQALNSLTRFPVPLMDALYNLIYYAGSMYQDFYRVAASKSVSNRGRVPDNVVNSIAQQITDGGPWSANMEDIDQLRQDVNQQVHSGK